MATWKDLASGAPVLARLGKRLLFGRAMLATIRVDGSPRINPVCPVLLDEHLAIGVRRDSTKYQDLVRDGRCTLHAALGPADEEFVIRAVARPAPDAVIERVAHQTPAIVVPAESSLFLLDISLASGALYRPGPDALPIPDRKTWKDCRDDD